MKIPAAGREYVSWTLTGADADTALAVSFDGETWHDLEWPTATTARVLVAGPDATDNPPGTVVLPAGRSTVTIRATDTPEVVVRGGGAIDVQ